MLKRTKLSDNKNIQDNVKNLSKTKNNINKSHKTKITSTTKDTSIKSLNTKNIKNAVNSPKKSSSKTSPILEYYDLPYLYNQTLVKVLAQTPNKLFVYWDISDEDKNNFVKSYGEKFFSSTYPVLIVHNKTLNYSFEIKINDFANSWYLDINDEDCEYIIELGRKNYEKYNYSNIDDYIYFTSSNSMNTPNNHILFENFSPNVTYKNVKNNTIFSKSFTSDDIKYIKDDSNIYDLYKKLYKDKIFEELLDTNLNPPSSLSSSIF